VLVRRVKVLDQGAFAAFLPERKVHRLERSAQAALQVIERLGAVNVRFPGAEEVEVGTVQDQQLHGGLSNVEFRRSIVECRISKYRNAEDGPLRLQTARTAVYVQNEAVVAEVDVVGEAVLLLGVVDVVRHVDEVRLPRPDLPGHLDGFLEGEVRRV